MTADSPPVDVEGLPADGAVATAVEQAHRDVWALVLAATVPVAGDLDLAQECVQDAYVLALGAWARDGIPARPAAWLTVTARRRALDAHRRHQVLTRKLPLLAAPLSTAEVEASADVDTDTPIPDDRLRLVFTCCHPALARESQSALTLRTVCGLSTAEVAAVFLVSESTMAARLTRAKAKITAAGIPYRVPGAAELPARLDAVLTVVHLLATTAHTTELTDPALAATLTDRALLLARTLTTLMPDEPEPRGLLALLLLTQARNGTRAQDGTLVLLADQDRTRWDQRLIAEATALVPTALRGRSTGRFGLQAAINALHTEAPTSADTDWPQILALYDELLRVWPSPVVALNRAVAVAEVHGPDTALALLEDLQGAPRLAAYPYLPATRADLLRRLHRPAEAATAYRVALDLTAPGPEHDFLTHRLHQLGDHP